MSRRMLIAAVTLLIALGVSAQIETLDSLRSCVKREFRNGTSHAEARRWAETIRSDGTWKDIDYNDKSRSLWQLEKHLDRIIAISHWQPGHTAAIKGLRHWFDGKYINDNWWYQKIGMPRRLLSIAYLLDEYLTDELRDSLKCALKVIDANDFPARPGGDRIQVLSNQAKALLWERNYAEVPHLFSLIEKEARIAPIEEIMFDAGGGLEVRNAHRPAGRGFQSDMSFHHRGDRVDCTLTYGMEVPEFFIYWDNLLKTTPWEFSPESRRFVSDYIEDGVRWHLVNDMYTEPAAYNRELARPVTKPFLIDFKGDKPLVGARYFNQSGYFSFKRQGFQTAVRFHSARNANQEAAHNNEGIRNHYRGDGACHLSVTGREYLNIWPLFDFRKIPGATTPLTPYSDMPVSSVQMRNSPIHFAGAVTDSLYGACALDFETFRSDLKARKSWFFFDKGYVCLGSGISDSSGNEIVTTVEQCLSSDKAFYEKDGWFVHDGNSYLILEGKPDVTLERRKGTWANCVTGAEQESMESSEDVFEITINHGARPNADRYAYIVAPNAEAPDKWFSILEHSDSVHAVSDPENDVCYITFFEPSEISYGNIVISVSQPCMAMIRGKEILFAEPTHLLDSLKVTVTQDGMTKSHVLKLPTWQNAGTTITLLP